MQSFFVFSQYDCNITGQYVQSPLQFVVKLLKKKKKKEVIGSFLRQFSLSLINTAWGKTTVLAVLIVVGGGDGGDYVTLRIYKGIYIFVLHHIHSM